jgi:hypothetical protein
MIDNVYEETETLLTRLCQSCRALEKIKKRLAKEKKEPRVPLPALSSACSYVLKNGSLDRRTRAHFSSLRELGQLMRTGGTRHAMAVYLDGFCRRLRERASSCKRR